jgi:hypothetical protein
MRMPNPELGEWSIQVTGFNVPHGPQPFAVVMNGAFADWPPPDPAGVGGRSAPSEPFLRVFPNPIAGNTSLHYAVPAGYTGPVRLEIADVQGRLVRSLVDKGQTSGGYRVSWQTQDDLGRLVPNGVYFARFTAGPHTARAKLVVQR